MALNTYVSLPAPAGNSSGAAVDVSLLGGTKTISVEGNGSATEPFVLIEISNDPAALVWTPLVQYQIPGERTINVAARWMRATTQNYKGGGAPTVSVGAETSSASFATVVAPAANGSGASVDVSALGALKTVQVGGSFRGTVVIEVSEDGGSTWSEALSFAAPGFRTSVLSAQFMRATRTGVPDVTPGLPVIYVGGLPFGGGLDVGVAISASGNSVSSGTVVFGNANNISFGMVGSTVTASVSAPIANAIQTLTAGTTNATGPGISFGNANNVSFGLNGNTLTASVAPELGIGLGAGTQTMATGTVIVSNANGVSFGLDASTLTASIAAGATATGNLNAIYAGTQSATSGTVFFDDSNGVTFGLDTNNRLTATINRVAVIGVSAPGAAYLANGGSLIFANGTNVSFTGSADGAGISISGSVAAQTSLEFSNANNVTFGIAGSTVTASASFAAQSTAPGGLGVVGSTITNGTIVFGDANGVGWGIAGSTVTASYSQSTAPRAIAVNGSTVTAGSVVITDANNVSFGYNGSTITASASYSQSTAPAAVQVNGSALTNGTLVITNANNVSFGLNGSTLTATASYAAQSTAPAAIAVNTEELTSGTVYFSNANNITWGRNGQTVTASASYSQSTAPAAVQVNGSTLTNGTLVVTNANNVSFGLNGSTLTASASYSQSTAPSAIQVNGSTLTNGTLVITNSNNVSFGLNGSTLTASATFAAGGGSASMLAFGIGINTIFTSYSATMPQTRLQWVRTDVPLQIVVTQAVFKATNIGAANRTLSMGMYILTMGGSTAGTVASMSGTGEVQAGQAGWVTMTMNPVTLSAGDYLFAISRSATTDCYPAAIENFRPSTGQFGAYNMASSTLGATVQLSQMTAPFNTVATQPAWTLFGSF